MGNTATLAGSLSSHRPPADIPRIKGLQEGNTAMYRLIMQEAVQTETLKAGQAEMQKEGQAAARPGKGRERTRGWWQF